MERRDNFPINGRWQCGLLSGKARSNMAVGFLKEVVSWEIGLTLTPLCNLQHLVLDEPPPTPRCSTLGSRVASHRLSALATVSDSSPSPPMLFACLDSERVE